ncbi:MULTISPECIES: phosphate ABC transporter permease subunit PstC [Trichocoleus]|uniref:Phosphate transport system permease protein n=1 Tax=Trichocoleus desertorum GB2-A4 TaxID=2933944 RepID=A0ABV0J3A1_9CYAN|nr:MULTISPECIES: phosphate ABC transporter permease subunit PstC [unclassified Trichocoleus]MBD1861589.1 phosphate ABC transporter permease subunit PstC [Trichocoleus sp. FACHB-46]MBD2098495.1 phosphate ABC transporter permease subunit PstC [Trichocoleus sp. FACHB-591]MBD2124082.1 phosphate ABC transporter permease subunit PstC [Trichocoleus sp. FACHB-262]
MTLLVRDSQETIHQRSPISRYVNIGFKWLTGFFAVAIGLTLLAIAWQVANQSWPAIQQFGLGFLTSSAWNPVEDQYGAWPSIYGTLVSSFIALLLSLPIGVGVALFLSEDFLPPRIQQPLVFLIELLAAIPSVVYGLWGIFVLIPLVGKLALWLHQHLGWVPFFSTPPRGPGMYIAGVILAIMTLPIIAAISRDALVAVPSELRQASYGLGATRWETIFKVMLPSAFSGIVGATMLGLGRALGETMAVTMVIGNANTVSPSIFSPATTIASLLANQFAEASGLQISSLMYTALILFALTLVVNILAELLVRSMRQSL